MWLDKEGMVALHVAFVGLATAALLGTPTAASVMRLLSQEEQVLVRTYFQGELEAAEEAVAAAAAGKAAELRRLLVEASLLHDHEALQRRGRVLGTVDGDEWTALSSLYSSTQGASWAFNGNWMLGDPCTASW